MRSSREFFNNFADRFDTFYGGKRSQVMQWIDQHYRRDMFERFHMTFDFLGNLHNKRVIDIGCGSGPYLVEALERGASHVTGIDPAPRMLTLAKERVAQLGMLERVALVEGYFPQTCPQGPFDFAIVMGVMDYVENTTSFLEGLQSIVSRGAVLSFPSTHWFRTPIRKVRYQLRSCPVYFYTEPKLEALMKKADVRGHKLVKIPGAGLDYFVWMSV